ncbi:MAG: iron-containing alcohol dehydrogenase [Treponema sp.]|jgi:alcohol dehydrogenase|nr:iron-containing alcohol dehydrogenase [Treponema sp.]
MDISFRLDPETIIGTDTLSMAGTICSRYGNRLMVAADHDLDSQYVKRLKDILEDSGIETIIFDGIQEDSGVDMADNIVELCRAAHCSAVLGFGGPKTQTIARMTAIMAPMRVSSFELLDGRKFKNKFLPFIAIPTAGIDTFLFSDFFAVVDPRDRLVRTIASPEKLCAALIVDSNLSFSLSGNAAAVFIFEGLCNTIEAYCSTRTNFFSDALLERALFFFIKMLKGGSENIDAENIAQADFLSSMGLALSSPGIGAALPLAINARSPIPKQNAAAALLPFLTEKLAAARPEKIARVASFFGNTKGASVAESANSSVDAVRRCMDSLGVKPSLKEFNVSLDRLMAAAESARCLEFVSNSPWIVSQEDLFSILKQIL